MHMSQVGRKWRQNGHLVGSKLTLTSSRVSPRARSQSSRITKSFLPSLDRILAAISALPRPNAVPDGAMEGQMEVPSRLDVSTIPGVMQHVANCWTGYDSLTDGVRTETVWSAAPGIHTTCASTVTSTDARKPQAALVAGT